MEWLSIASDLFGLVAALLLAIPAVHTQRIRDQADDLDAILVAMTNDDPTAKRMAEDARRTHGRLVFRLSQRDYWFALAGTGLLAAAFFLKLAASAIRFVIA
jgi:hypothetical protein